MINIVLFEPEKPLNVGSIGRTCVLTGSHLHIIRPITFEIDDKSIKRGGMDYWKQVKYTLYDNFDDFLNKNPGARIHVLTTKAKERYCDIDYKDGDYLLFGKESAGLPKDIMERYKDSIFRVPMISTTTRSLNLSNTVAIVTYEALKALDFPGMI